MCLLPSNARLPALTQRDSTRITFSGVMLRPSSTTGCKRRRREHIALACITNGKGHFNEEFSSCRIVEELATLILQRPGRDEAANVYNKIHPRGTISFLAKVAPDYSEILNTLNN